MARCGELALTLVGLLVMAAGAPAQQLTPTDVGLGVTEVLAGLTPEIGYQYFGKGPSSLGFGWTGFDGASGVYWQPESGENGTYQVFMHCPWRGGTGITFAEYWVKLPDTPRVRMTFDIGMRPTARGTDGVTYSVSVGDEVLFEQHCPWKEFRTLEADLSAYAGKAVKLRLQVHPGPDKDTRDDWSLWRNIRLLAGTDAEMAVALKQAQEREAKRRAAELDRGEQLGKVSLLPLTSHTSDSICPSVLEPTTVSTRADGNRFTFRCEGDQTIEYRFDAGEGVLGGLEVAVDGQALNPPPFAGGPRVLLDGQSFMVPTTLLKTELVSAELADGKLSCSYRYTNPQTGSAAEMSVKLWPEGKSLGLEISGEPGKFSGFNARPDGGRAVPTAFCPAGPPMWRKEGLYLSTAFDLMRSEASHVGDDAVTYTPLTDGAYNTMHDYCYLTVSGRYEETLPNVAHKPSPYLDDLARRLVLDAWGGGFAGDEKWLNDMAAYGLDSFLIIKHVWQRDGYDQTYPNTIPANAAQGGDEALRSLSLRAQELGHLFNVHENYYDYYPNAEDFKQEDCALDAAGEEQTGWDNGRVVAKILKPSKLMEYVYKFTPEIKRRYECNSAYHDIMPTWRVDYEAGFEGAGKIRYTHDRTRDLCDYDREIFGGPVVFEAADWHMAGVYDGGCNHGVDTYRTPVSVASEVLKTHPKMSNHGFGYYERWLPWGYGPGWGSYVMTDAELDKYRAYQISFGRTGFIGQQLMPHAHGLVREYYLMQAFGRAYTGRLAETLRYQMDGKWVDAGTAARYGEFERLNVGYEDGQRVYVNLAEEPLEVEGQTLPQFGALTTGPRCEAWTAIRDGQVCDYARFDDVEFVDARSHVWQPEDGIAPITPSVASVKHLGGAQFEMTVNWMPGRTLDRDYVVFWHFRHNGQILFQSDHSSPRPTTQWQVGQTVVDGPIRITVPDDAMATSYDIVVGLYSTDGRAKVTSTADETAVGRLVVTRDKEKAVGVSFDAMPGEHQPGSDPGVYFEGSNRERKVIDFGAVATNGALVVQKVNGGLEIIPVPLGEKITVGIGGLSAAGTVTEISGDGATRKLQGLSRHDGRTWFETSESGVKYTLTF